MVQDSCRDECEVSLADVSNRDLTIVESARYPRYGGLIRLDCSIQECGWGMKMRIVAGRGVICDR
jgi:hypothetical protein